MMHRSRAGRAGSRSAGLWHVRFVRFLAGQSAEVTRARWPSGDPSCVLSVDTVPASVLRIRRFVVAACREGLGGELCETAALLVSEVATNALVHGSGRIEVRVLVTGRVLRVEVADSSSDLPAPRHADALDEGGRGLALVDVLASSWGAEPDELGKVVWFEVTA